MPQSNRLKTHSGEDTIAAKRLLGIEIDDAWILNMVDLALALHSNSPEVMRTLVVL